LEVSGGPAWLGPALLDSYGAECRPIGARNIAASRRAAKGRRAWRQQWRPEIAEDSPAGEAVRTQIITVAEREQRWSNDLYGIELGYQYTNSPILVNGEDTNMTDIESGFIYRPIVEVGYRLPNTWMSDGRSIQDVIGDEYVLIVNQNELPPGPGLVGEGVSSYRRLVARRPAGHHRSHCRLRQRLAPGPARSAYSFI
jgi:hypothetical protein